MAVPALLTGNSRNVVTWKGNATTFSGGPLGGGPFAAFGVAAPALIRLGRFRVAAEQHGIGVDAVVEHVEERGRDLVGFAAAGSLHGRVHVRDPDPAAHIGGTQTLHGETVAEELVVRRGQGAEQPGLTRGIRAERIPVQGHSRGVVQGQPGVDPVPEHLAHLVRVVAETHRRVPVQPAAAQP